MIRVKNKKKWFQTLILAVLALQGSCTAGSFNQTGGVFRSGTSKNPTSSESPSPSAPSASHPVSTSSTAPVRASYSIQVLPQYPAAPSWNTYIQASNPSANCLGTEDQASLCVHGGEFKKVITQETSCAGLTLTDELEVFEWTCEVDEASGFAVFSSSLASGKGLAHLLEVSGDPSSTEAVASWRSNRVTLRRSSSRADDLMSESTQWWSNPVRLAPRAADDATRAERYSLAEAQAIYVVPETRVSPGYLIEADGVGLVVLEGAELQQGSGTALTEFIQAGQYAFSSPFVLQAEVPRKHIWIEGSFTGAQAQPAVALYTNSFSRVNLLRAGTLGAPRLLDLTQGRSTRVTGLVGETNSQVSVSPSDYRGLEMSDVSLKSTSTFALSLMGRGARLSRLQLSGMVASFASDAVIDHLTIDATGSTAPANGAVEVRNFSRNLTLTDFTIDGSPTAADGLYVDGTSTGGWYQNGVIRNSTLNGITVRNSSNTRIDQVTVKDAGGRGIQLSAAGASGVLQNITLSRVRVSGAQSQAIAVLPIDGATESSLSGVRIVQSTVISDASVALMVMYPIGIQVHQSIFESTAPGVAPVELWETARYGFSQSVFVRPGAASDPSLALHAFTNQMLGVGKFAGQIGFAGARRCELASASGTLLGDLGVSLTACDSTGASSFTPASLDVSRIFVSPDSLTLDDRLMPSSEGGVLYNRGRAFAGESLNPVFPSTVGAPCPSFIAEEAVASLPFCHGQRTISSESECVSAGGTWTPEQNYLLHALEKLGDSVGDDDGLCESSEACLYSPHPGYIIENDLGGEISCAYSSSGSVTGVSLSGYVQD